MVLKTETSIGDVFDTYSVGNVTVTSWQGYQFPKMKMSKKV
jgi:dissimilatory sulfite reductase (desulfoviridin) alpha/beta subunit